MTDSSAETSGAPDFTPDFGFWANMPGWRFVEAAALFHLLDPLREDEWFETLSPDLLMQLKKTTKFLSRSHTMGLIKSPGSPRSILRFALNNGVDVPDVLRLKVEGGRRITNWKKKYLDLKNSRSKNISSKTSAFLDVLQNPTPKRVNSLFKLIYAMAFVGYKHQNTKSAVKEIHTDVGIAELSLGKDAILNILRLAYEVRGEADMSTLDDIELTESEGSQPISAAD